MLAALKDIMELMEGAAPSRLAEEWDNTGLAVGDPERKIKRVLVALDAIDPVIDEAVEKKADLILTHHPMLLFRKINSINRSDALGGRIYKLIENNIAAFSAHTNLDIVKGGLNDVLADIFGLENTEILEETWHEELQKIVVYVPEEQLGAVREAMTEAGGGHIGSYSHCTFETRGEGTFLPLEGTNPFIGKTGRLERVREARLETIVPKSRTKQVIGAMLSVHPYEEAAYDIYDVAQKGKCEGIGRIGDLKEPKSFAEVAAMLRERLELGNILRLVGDKKTMIGRIGLCTGSGAEFMSAARDRGADLYLTGDLKYHEAQKALEMGLCVADITHYGSEVIIVPVLKRLLEEAAEKNGWELDVIESEINGQTFWSL